MKLSKIIRRSSLLFILIMIVCIFPVSVMAAQPPVNLGTTASFAVLAGTTIAKTPALTTIKAGETSNIVFWVIGLIMLGLAGGLLLVLLLSRRQTRTVTLNSDYRISNQKK